MSLFHPGFQRPRRKVRIGLVPMINVVFLLMIFFLVAGTIEPSNQQGMTLPVAYSGEHRYTPDDLRSLTVILKTDGGLTLNNTRVVSLTLLDMALHQHIGHNPNIPITILADATAPAATLTDVVRRITLAGAQNLTIATMGP